MVRRREILKTAMVFAAAQLSYAKFAQSAAPQKPAPPTAVPKSVAATGGGPAKPFDYAWLKGHARFLAGNAFQASKDVLPPSMAGLSYDQFQSLRFRTDHALWGDAGLPFRLQFFHVGRSFSQAVHLYEIVDGRAREILYDPSMFEFDKAGIDPAVMRDRAGFAGFRVQFVTDWKDDVSAFLGAAYFRAVGGDTRQYGLSARALAVDTAYPRPEEFPRFTSFWFERPPQGSDTLTMYALMDSPSIAGALRFFIEPGATLAMDIDSALYPRKPIDRLGIAPLTSMFYYGENDRRAVNDWRPEVHDSDGLSMWTGSGEWIWRPLTNPAQNHLNSYFDENPRGFGLMQRDRVWDHYQDDGVYYDRRPSLWVEPKSGGHTGWGKGAVQLFEIPTADETSDNIVAFWNPGEKTKAGQELLFGYRLYWGTHMPYASPLAQTIATRTGIGGTIGQKRQYYSWHFAVDFSGGELGALPRDTAVEAVISASRGTTEHVTAHFVDEFKGYRALFDIRPPDDSNEAIDLRLYLRIDGRPLTETWIYQWMPPPVKDRKAALG
ncbi:MAG TPA: glucan biosynthesis protein D [Steroidobacteraceae bacterium]|jgi:glucans biosynthesis protein|nr:glucan biosynthesis protein D [Steroidobacteraceae bacterium]